MKEVTMKAKVKEKILISTLTTFENFSQKPREIKVQEARIN